MLRELRGSWEHSDLERTHLSWHGYLAHIDTGLLDMCLQQHDFQNDFAPSGRHALQVFDSVHKKGARASE